MNNVVNAVMVVLMLIISAIGVSMQEETGLWFPLLMMVTTVIFYTLSVIELVQSTRGNK